MANLYCGRNVYNFLSQNHVDNVGVSEVESRTSGECERIQAELGLSTAPSRTKQSIKVCTT